MKAIDELKTEHVLIGRMLTVLERVLENMNGGIEPPPGLLSEAIEFIRGYADKCHHSKEESALFPLMAAQNKTIGSGPVRILTGEHEAGRELIRDLESSQTGLASGDTGAWDGATRALTLYTRLLRKHIAKEEDIVFPLAVSLISASDGEALADRFEAIELAMRPEAHAYFEHLVEVLEQTVNPEKSMSPAHT